MISFSTEFYYFIEFGLLQVSRQYEWLEKDLIVSIGVMKSKIMFLKISFQQCVIKKEATKPENRAIRPCKNNLIEKHKIFKEMNLNVTNYRDHNNGTSTYVLYKFRQG